MNHWSFFDLTTGHLIGVTFSGPDAAVQANTPPGCKAVSGTHDHLCRRVDLASGEVVVYQPPRPSDDAYQTWAWDGVAERWICMPTAAAIAAEVRSERARRLAACDWVILRAAEHQGPVPTDWLAYRAALRDIPLQPGFPSDIEWPVPPGAVIVAP